MWKSLAWKRFAGLAVLCILCLAAVFSGAALLPPGFADFTIATGLTNASTMSFAPDGRLFIGQQNGVVRVLKNGVLLPTPFVAVPANASNERGLVGIAFDPGFSSNNFVYLDYTTNSVSPNVVQRISRFTASGDVAVPGSETIVIETDPFSATSEVGGGLRFGPDGMLYIGIGQCSGNSQVTNSLFGKILRIRSDGTIPADNPFFNQNTGKNQSVWALGFRNPFTMSIQRGTGRVFINDVGSANTVAREEINDGAAGANYGWPTCEGQCSPPNTALKSPIYAYGHVNNFNALTSGDFYNPPALMFPKEYVGKYFFGDLATSAIQLFDPATTNATLFASGLSGNLVSLQVGPDGALYYLVQSAAPLGGGIVGKIIYGAQTLLPFGSTWKYLDTGITNLSASWVQSGFDDSTWSNGLAQLGWGANGEVTLVRSNRADNSRIITTYFRKAFVLSNTAPFSNYVVNVVRDDGAVVYVNGSEVFRSNMPTGAVSSATLATLAVGSADEKAVYGGIVNPSLVVNGTNVIAVEIHQQATNAATDMSFDLSLLSVNGNADLKAIAPGGGGDFVLSYPSWATGFSLEMAPSVPSAAWSPVTNASTVVSNEIRVSVGLGASNQFFRLRSP